MTHTTDRVDTTVFRRLLSDYAECLRNGDFQDAGAALLAVVAEYQQAARRAPVVSAAQMPEPAAKVVASNCFREKSECINNALPVGTKLYTEQQVRALLAEVSTPAAQEGWCDGCSPDNCCGCGPNQEREKK